MSEEIITHSSLVDKLIVGQNIDIPVRSGKLNGYEADKERTIRTISHRRAVARAGANLEVSLHKISDRITLLQNNVKKMTPKSFLLFFALVSAILTTSYENTREKLHVLHRAECRVRYGISRRVACYSLPRAAGMIFLIISVLAVVSTTLVGVGLQVSVDGEPVGFVSKRSEFTEVVSRVERKVSQIVGYPYSLEADITYNFEMFNRKEMITPQLAERKLFSGIGEVTQAYVLTVDGEEIGAYPEKEKIDTALSGILKGYAGENVDSVEFLRDVKVSLQYTDVNNIKSFSQINDALSANIRDEETYTVQSGDMFETIASKFGLSTSALEKMNPDVDINRIKVGQVLTVNQPIPLMSVKTVENIVYTEDIPYATEYVDDSTLFVGTTKVKVKGELGLKEISAQLISVDGHLDQETITGEKVINEPVTEVIRKGTKKRVATGKYIVPFNGTVSSRYGWRLFRGRYNFHTGIDFAGARGSRIVASDGGTVSFAGWKGSYGYAVIINHGGGKQTLYAHCSSLNVSAGQKVAQGETIARVGSTGNSTGPHVHFEIIINGNKVNPAGYLW